MRSITFAEGEYYHVYNRGVEQRDIFCSKRDHERFLFDLFACNDEQPLENSTFFYRGLASIESYASKIKRRKQLVSILCFCLMPNHFHLLLKQHGERGIPAFMQKLGTAYTMYFNTKNHRTGVLFQGTYKAAHVEEERYLTHLSRYIHLNPLDLPCPHWKEKGIENTEKARTFLREYPWSSYADYLGHTTYPTILATELLGEVIGQRKHYAQFTEEWAGIQNLAEISDLTIEA